VKPESLTTPDDDDLVMDLLDTPVRDRSLCFLIVNWLTKAANKRQSLAS
jgi:hypothetical protein